MTARLPGILVAAIFAVGLSTVSVPSGASVTGFAQIIRVGTMGVSHCQFAAVDVDLGTVTPIGVESAIEIGGCPVDMAFRADGRLFGVLNFGTAATPSQLVSIDPGTGARTPIGSLGFATSNGGLAFDAAGSLWYYALKAQNGPDPNCPGNSGQSCLYRLDPDSGAATLVGAGGLDDQVIGATATCDSVFANQLVPVMNAAPTGQLVTLNTATAALSPAPNPYGTLLMVGLEVDTSGVLHGLGFSFDPGTGAPQAPATYRIEATTGIATKIADITTLDPDQILAALAISGHSCTTTPPAAPAIARLPDFTG